MSDQFLFDVAMGVLLILNGILSLRNARRGFSHGHQFITLSKNPIEPERMTPRMRRFMHYSGIFFLIAGTFIVAITMYRSLRG